MEVRRTAPDVGVLLLSQHVETHDAMRLMTEFEGGVGYLLKDRVADLATFAGDVRRVANGDCVIDREHVARLVDKKSEGAPLALMAEGRPNSALSSELCLSARTIEVHLRSASS